MYVNCSKMFCFVLCHKIDLDASGLMNFLSITRDQFGYCNDFPGYTICIHKPSVGKHVPLPS